MRAGCLVRLLEQVWRPRLRGLLRVLPTPHLLGWGVSTGSVPNVEVWLVRLASGAAARGLFRSYLSPQESARAKRFVNDCLAASYEVSHGVLRVLLSRYLGGKPPDVEFAFNNAGK